MNLINMSLSGIKEEIKKFDKNFKTHKPHKFIMFSDGSCGIVDCKDRHVREYEVNKNTKK